MSTVIDCLTDNTKVLEFLFSAILAPEYNDKKFFTHTAHIMLPDLEQIKNYHSESDEVVLNVFPTLAFFIFPEWKQNDLKNFFNEGGRKLEFRYGPTDTARLVTGWLNDLTDQDYPQSYFGDGSVKHGLFITTMNLYRFDSLFGSEPEVVIQPKYVYYGK